MGFFKESDNESGLSDSVDYLDSTKLELAKMELQLKPCTRKSIINMYDSEKPFDRFTIWQDTLTILEVITYCAATWDNSSRSPLIKGHFLDPSGFQALSAEEDESVYQMTSPIRGRCLVINILKVKGVKNRPGSEIDTENICRLFEELKFDVNLRENTTSKKMIEVTEKETSKVEHEKYGMFVLVVMTHGNQTHLQGGDGNTIERAELLNLLSAKKFPQMKGKPKLVIFQTCAGGNTDSLTSHDEPSEQLSVDLPSHSAAVDALSDEWKYGLRDDFFILMPSPDDFSAPRYENYGSPFIRAIVETFYKHSCHRDVETLFKDQIYKKIKLNCQRPEVPMQTPTIITWPTPKKKLYLFPGYNPPEK
ncbi:caspase-3-like [Watersipora subatra]|uniref:caspase-3-like n=1 Tax=Watersipora subatra TaxID=2589382 RepID=UPI00355BE70E